MRHFRWSIPILILACAIGNGTRAAEPVKDAPPVEGAKQLGRYAIGIAMNMDFATGPTGPFIVGLDGVFAAKRTWTAWDGATGKVLARFSNTRGTLTADDAAPVLTTDGTKLALVYRWQISMFSKPTDQVETVIYEVKSGKALIADKRKGSVNGLLFTPKGALLLFDDTSCHVMEPGKDKFARSFKLAAPMSGSAAVSPDDARLAIYSLGTLYVYNLAEGKLEFELATDSKPKKEDKTKVGDKNPGTLFVGAGASDSAMISFSTSSANPKLVISETTMIQEPGADPKAFAGNVNFKAQLRVIDIKEKKQTDGFKLPKDVFCSRVYFNAEGEPLALISTAILEPMKEPGKEPVKPKVPPKGPGKLDTLEVLGPAQKTKFQIITMAGKAIHEFTLTNPPLLIPDAPMCYLTADGRYLLAVTTSEAQQKKSNNIATVWDLSVGK